MTKPAAVLGITLKVQCEMDAVGVTVFLETHNKSFQMRMYGSGETAKQITIYAVLQKTLVWLSVLTWSISQPPVN